MTSYRHQFTKCVSLFFALNCLAPNLWADEAQDPELLKKGGEEAIQPSAPLPLNELRVFAEIFDRIKTHYVEEVDDKTLLENAIKGMVSGLDPHSAYLGPEAFGDLQFNTTGKFGGLGIEVGMENGFVKVVAPIDDTPAQKAGILAKDIIIKLDDQSVKGMELSEAVDKMRGEPGSKIKLTIVREGVDQPLEFELTRAEIKVASVKQELLQDDYGYIRVTQFQVQTGDDVTKSIKKLTKSNGGPLNGLILDLRNNPGGVLDAAVDVSDAFLSEGLIVYTEGRVPNSELRFSAKPGDPSKGVPLVVLINEGSASASEIVAGALQDHNRAVIVGTDSFGKGSVQTVLPLNGTHAVKLTTARYFTPLGRSIQAQGIEPDIYVQRASVKTDENRRYYKEADLAGHLANSNGKPEKGSQADDADNGQKKSKLLNADYQLNEALNILKGIQFYRLGNKPKATNLAKKNAADKS